MTILARHVDASEKDDLMFPALCHYIGYGKPVRLFPDIELPPPASIQELNEGQRSVAHPLCMRTAREVAGPPGTGTNEEITTGYAQRII